MFYNQYPLFRPLEREDKPVFDEAFGKDPPEISEFTFTNLYVWREIYNLKVSVLEGALVLRSDADNASRFFPPIGSADTKYVIEKVLETSAGIFMRIPEETKTLFDRDERFNIKLESDNSDYLFKVSDLVSLKGRKYDGKRNLIKKFKSVYGYRYVKLNGSNIKRCLEFQERWCSIKDCDNVKGLDDEKRAISEIVENFSAFELIGAAIEVNDNIYAVAIGERLNPNTLVMHVLKADPGMVGLYQTINNEFLSLEARDFEFVNLEQDLGSEGIRKAKFSYHPIGMVKKYTLSLK